MVGPDYVLEITTESFPAIGSTAVQRVAFGVRDVVESELLRAQQPTVAVTTSSAAERARYVGTYAGTGVRPTDPAPELVLSVWEEGERLFTSGILPREWDDEGAPVQLFPMGERLLASARDLDGLIHLLSMQYQFSEAPGG